MAILSKEELSKFENLLNSYLKKLYATPMERQDKLEYYEGKVTALHEALKIIGFNLEIVDKETGILIRYNK